MPDIENVASPDEREYNKQVSTKKRIVVLVALCAAVIVVRLIIKDPPPPKGADHSTQPFRAIPGVLKNLSETDRKKLTPEQVALLQEADQKVVQGSKPQEKLAKATYIPAEAPVQIAAEMKAEAKKFDYAQRRKAHHEVLDIDYIDQSKDTLVIFVQGGYVKAEEALRVNGSVHIKMDQNMRAQVPQSSVRLIASNAAAWTEPIPTGFTQLKPAKGITVILSSKIANRITLPSRDPDEI